MKRAQAVKEAREVLENEANCLAVMMHEDKWKTLTNRERIAIRREVERLRQIAENLGPKGTRK